MLILALFAGRGRGDSILASFKALGLRDCLIAIAHLNMAEKDERLRYGVGNQMATRAGMTCRTTTSTKENLNINNGSTV